MAEILARRLEAHARGEDIPIDRFAEAQAPLFDVPGGEKIDTVVLACTHFPLVRGQLIASAPQSVSYVDSGAAIARQTIRVLPVETEARGIGGHAYLTSEPEDEADLALVQVTTPIGVDGVKCLLENERCNPKREIELVALV